MDCSIIMECSMLTNQDLKELNESSTTEYQIVTSNNFLPPETIYILVELGKSLIFSAAYDLLKYELSKILKIASGKKNITNLTVSCDGRTCNISCNFELSEDQKEKIIDNAIKNLMEK